MLRKAEPVEEMQSIIGTYQFEHTFGLLSGQQGAGLYSTEVDTREDDRETRDCTKEASHHVGGGSAQIDGAGDATGVGDNSADGGAFTVFKGGGKGKGGK